MKEKNEFTELELKLFTKDLDIYRYVGGSKIDKFKLWQMATTTYPKGYGHGPRTHNESIALNTIDRPCVKVKGGEMNEQLRIRKLVPLETLKLMGFTETDYQAMRDIGMSDSQIYHCAGDSIITTCLMAIFGELLQTDYVPIIEDYVRGLVNE